MRLEQPDFSNIEPVVEDEQKKTFVDPKNPENLIVVFDEPYYMEKPTPRQLRGSFYMTKIAHALLPNNVPDIYQIGEDKKGLQTMDRPKVIENEKGTNGNKPPKLQSVLKKFGLSDGMDSNMENYIEDGNGNIQYIENFRAWKRSNFDRRNLELLFKEKTLRNKIGKIEDETIREECLKHLDRILELFAEEQQEIIENLIEPDGHIKKFEDMIREFLEPELLDYLHMITTEEEAEKNEKRENARRALIDIDVFLKSIKEETSISDEEHDRLYNKKIILQKAIGAINRGIVDHTR